MATVEFNGTMYEVPDDMPDDQIRQSLMGDQKAKQPPPRVTQEDADQVPFKPGFSEGVGYTSMDGSDRSFGEFLSNPNWLALPKQVGGLLAEGAVKLAGDKENLLSNARKAEVFEKWNPKLQAATDKLLSVGDKKSLEYQKAFEIQRQTRRDFVDDMNGEFIETKGSTDWGALMEFAGENPGFAMGSLALAIAEDPELVGIGSGAKVGAMFVKFSKQAKLLKDSAKAAAAIKATGEVAGMAGVTGAVGATFSGAEMLDADGEINFDKLIDDTKVAAGLGGILGLIPAGSTAMKFRNRVKDISEQRALTFTERKATKLGVKIDDITPQTLLQDIDTMTGMVGKDLSKANKHIEGKASDLEDIIPDKQFIKTLFSDAKKEGLVIPEKLGAKEVEDLFTKAFARGRAAETETAKEINRSLAGAPEVAGNVADDAVKLGARNALKNQSGKITPKQAIFLGAVAGSGMLGYSREGDIGDAAAAAALMAGGIGGAVLLTKGVAKLKSGYDKVMAANQRTNSMMWFIDGWETMIDGAGLETDRFINKMQLMFNKEEMALIRQAREGVIAAPSEKIASGEKIVKQFFDNHFERLNKEEVINSYLENFIPHLVNTAVKTPEELAQVKTILSKGLGAGTRTRHDMQRIYATLEDLKAAGFEVITEDLGEIMRAYSNATTQTLANKVMTNNLKQRSNQFGNNLIVGFDRPVEKVLKSGKIKIVQERVKPKPGTENEYVEFTHPAFRNTDGSYQKVHKEIADSLGLIYDTTLNPSATFEAVKLLNMSMKRMVVSYSLFHAKALIESLFFATGVKEGGKSMYQLMSEMKKKGSHPMLQQYYYGQRGDLPDMAVRAGLKLSKPDDINSDKFRQLVSIFEKKLEGTGFLGKAASYPTTKLHNFLHKNIDTLMWDKVMTSSKLVGFAKNFEKAKIRNIQLNKKNPAKFPLMSDEILAKKVAQFTNDAFGGLDWARLAESATTKLGFGAMNLLSKKKNRGVAQLFLFAPDWTLANLRILGKSLPGFKDMIPLLGKDKDAVLNSLHRDYAVRATLLFLAGQEVISQVATGEQSPIFNAIESVAGGDSFDWDRSEKVRHEDLLMANIGGGDVILTSKQYVEVYEWLLDPRAVAWNKMGSLPKKVISLFLGYEYLNPRNLEKSPKIVTNREKKESDLPSAVLNLKEYAKSFAASFRPIIADQAINKDNFVGALLATPKKHLKELE